MWSSWPASAVLAEDVAARVQETVLVGLQVTLPKQLHAALFGSIRL
jgi:hypothetical protein